MSDQSHSRSAAVVLSIAGSDNTAGAGIQADIKTGAAFGVYVATAITAVTVQGGTHPVVVHPLSSAQLADQIDRVLETLPVAAIKLGMLATTELLMCVANKLAGTKLPVVIDPVLTASAGGQLFKGEQAVTLYREKLLPLATILTPNLIESAQLLGRSQAQTEAEMIEQATLLQTLGAESVLIKGGHSQLRLATDFLLCEGQTLPFSSPWLSAQHTHGSGCTLASAIAAGLAQGLTTAQSVAAAKSYIQGAIGHAERLQLVAEGGPLHHFYQYW